jgi:hypothetical protein
MRLLTVDIETRPIYLFLTPWRAGVGLYVVEKTSQLSPRISRKGLYFNDPDFPE